MEEEAHSEERGLCTVVRVKSLSPIEGADKVVLAEVNGWQCVVAKDEGIHEGDLALYYCIDSIPDLEDPNCALVKKRGGRIKTIKLRGIISQGLLAPLAWMESRGHEVSDLAEGDDVTEQMGATKFIHEEEADQYITPRTVAESTDRSSREPYSREPWRDLFPSEVPKTDERRLQNNPSLLEYIADRNIVITRKEDGSSATFVYNDGEFSICGRNFKWLTLSGVSRNYYAVAEKLNLQEGLAALRRNVAVQGELVGPKVNSNRMRLENHDFRVFNIWDIDSKSYLPWTEVESMCAALQVATVPVIYRGPARDLELTVPAFLQLAEQQKYTSQALAEGIVVKTDDESRRLSFKVISNKYLLKHKL